MKRLFITILLIHFLTLLEFSCFAANKSITTQIDETLSQLPQILRDDPTGAKAQEFIGDSHVSYGIQGYFYEVPGALMEHSYQRQNRIQEVEVLLQPYEKVLIELTQATLNSKNRDTNSLRLLAFFQETPDIKNLLLQIIRNPVYSRSLINQTYDTYFMLQLDNPQFRRNFVDFIKTNLNQRTTLGDLADGLYSMSGRWAVPEMEELYLQAIQTPILPENYIEGISRLSLIAKIRNAARGLDYYGTMPTNYIEALKARIKELDLTSGDERNTLQQLEQTLAIMEGRRMPEFAVSWKGQLLGISKETYRKWFGHDRVIQDAAVFDQSASNNKPMTNQPTNVVVTSLPIQPTTNKIIPETENSNWLRWVLIVIGLGIVGFLAFSFFGKKDSNREK